MAELMRNPKVMERTQKELRQVVVDKGKVEESDLKNLDYLKLVIKEALKLTCRMIATIIVNFTVPISISFHGTITVWSYNKKIKIK